MLSELFFFFFSCGDLFSFPERKTQGNDIIPPIDLHNKKKRDYCLPFFLFGFFFLIASKKKIENGSHEENFFGF